MRLYRLFVRLAAALLVAGTPIVAPTVAHGQIRGSDADDNDLPLPPPQPVGNSAVRQATPGQTPTSIAGRTGTRRTRQDVTGVVATARLSTRVSSRIQSRFRNRLDQSFDPLANGTSSFRAANEQTRRQGQVRR